MEMENDGKKTVAIIIYLVLIVAVIIVTVIGVNSNLKKSESKRSTVSNNAVVNSAEKERREITEKEIDKLTDGFLRALFTYSSKNGEELNTYLKGLNNSQKLYLGDIDSIHVKNKGRMNFTDIRNNIISVIGDDLEVQGEDYYIGNEKVPFYSYDKSGGYYMVNKEYEGGTDIITDISESSIYNYQIKEVNVEENTIYVYGLFKRDGMVEMLYNNNGLERYIGVDDMLEDMGYSLTDEEFLQDTFNNNVTQFLVFKYQYKVYEDGNFVLTDFSIVS